MKRTSSFLDGSGPQSFTGTRPKQPRLVVEDYTVGWISALPIELAAAQKMFDKRHDDIPSSQTDSNLYALGSIQGHNVVIACLPAGQTGTNSAASVAMQLKSRFPFIRFGLMVGIGGGVPSPKVDIRLGDVVISQPQGPNGGVIQYDLGKRLFGSHFLRTGSLNAPPAILLNALSRLQSNVFIGECDLVKHLSVFDELPTFARDKAGVDVLFEASFDHQEGVNCANCDPAKIVTREPRSSNQTVLHYGTIASGNQVMKNALSRDETSREFGGVLCFEMEAAGLMNNFPCLVIRGICDYADTHKTKSWQPYAAATAAACAKELLSLIPVQQVDRTRTAKESMNEEERQAKALQQSLVFPELKMREDDIVDAKNGTCEWIFRPSTTEETPSAGVCSPSKELFSTKDESSATPQFNEWLRRGNGIFWITGKAGSGKSVLLKHVVNSSETKTLLRIWAQGSQLLMPSFFFWKIGPSEHLRSIRGMIRSLLWQISKQPALAALVQNATGADHDLGAFTWTEGRLRSTLSRFIAHMSSCHRLCVFVDALDESSDDISKLLEIIEILLSGQGNVKICLSSRPEEFNAEFGATIQLRVQDFNREDIEQTAKEELLPFLARGYSGARQSGISELIRAVRDKSDGIFLWADLVLRDLKAGLRNRDDFEILERRLKTSPQTIEDLYNHMLGGISKFYWKEASLYFNILLCDADRGDHQNYTWTVLHLVFTDHEVREHFREFDWSYYQTPAFYGRCERIVQRLHSCCVGLVEIGNVQNTYEGIDVETQDRNDCFASTRNDGPGAHLRTVKFIHRSVAEFLSQRAQDFFKDVDWKVVGRAAGLDCVLGFMTVVPDLIARDMEGRPGCRRHWTFRDDPRVRHHDQSLVRVTDHLYDACRLCFALRQYPARIRNAPAQVYSIMEKVDRQLNGPDSPWPTHYELFVDNGYARCSFPFRDSIDFAAFSAMESHVQEHIHATSISPNKLQSIFSCAIAGMQHGPASEPEFGTEKLAAHFRLIKFCLEQGVDPNAPSVMHAHSWSGKDRAISWWAWFVQLSVLYVKDDRFPQSEFFATIEAFQVSGADMNARLWNRIDSADGLFLAIETSILWEARGWTPFVVTSCSMALEEWLQDHGASIFRRCHEVCESVGWRAPPRVWTVSEGQSEFLFREWDQNYNGEISDILFKKFFVIIQKGQEALDPILLADCEDCARVRGAFVCILLVV